jgi:hypothetical protein
MPLTTRNHHAFAVAEIRPDLIDELVPRRGEIPRAADISCAVTPASTLPHDHDHRWTVLLGSENGTPLTVIAASRGVRDGDPALFIDLSKIDGLGRLLARAGLGFSVAVRGASQLVVMSPVRLQLRVDHFLEHGFVRRGGGQSKAWHGDLANLFRKDRASPGLRLTLPWRPI